LFLIIKIRQNYFLNCGLKFLTCHSIEHLFHIPHHPSNISRFDVLSKVVITSHFFKLLFAAFNFCTFGMAKITPLYASFSFNDKIELFFVFNNDRPVRTRASKGYWHFESCWQLRADIIPTNSLERRAKRYFSRIYARSYYALNIFFLSQSPQALNQLYPPIRKFILTRFISIAMLDYKVTINPFFTQVKRGSRMNIQQFCDLAGGNIPAFGK